MRDVAACSFEGPECGLVPLAGPATATSTGLLYNVDDTPLRVGGLVSTSNQIVGEWGGGGGRVGGRGHVWVSVGALEVAVGALEEVAVGRL